jgi:hypothetical protein
LAELVRKEQDLAVVASGHIPARGKHTGNAKSLTRDYQRQMSALGGIADELAEALHVADVPGADMPWRSFAELVLFSGLKKDQLGTVAPADTRL